MSSDTLGSDGMTIVSTEAHPAISGKGTKIMANCLMNEFIDLTPFYLILILFNLHIDHSSHNNAMKKCFIMQGRNLPVGKKSLNTYWLVIIIFAYEIGAD
jgi:hypothetical protein